jgi:hypothetical protein
MRGSLRDALEDEIPAIASEFVLRENDPKSAREQKALNCRRRPEIHGSL